MATLRVTKAGPAADRADFSKVVDTATPGCELEFVDTRSSVVLFVVDSEVEPTRECIDTVCAIAQATGRIAVGLLGPGEFASVWRQQVDRAIPMGELDSRMARTLVLLAEGPPRHCGETPAARRARCVRAQLAAERSRGAAVAARWQHQLQADAEAELRRALEHLAEQPGADAAELHQRAARAAAELEAACGKLGLRVDAAVPDPQRPFRQGRLADGAMVAAAVGIAVGIFRIALMCLTWVGVSERVAAWVGVAAGCAVTAAAVVATIRRSGRVRAAQWRASYLAQLRRGWQQAVAAAVREALAERGTGWRLEQLAESAGITNRQ